MRRRGSGTGAGEDKHRLVGVGENDLLVHALGSWVQPDQGAPPWFDGFDASCPIWLAGNLHPVADRGNITYMFALLQAAAQVTGQQAVFGLHGEKA